MTTLYFSYSNISHLQFLGQKSIFDSRHIQTQHRVPFCPLCNLSETHQVAWWSHNHLSFYLYLALWSFSPFFKHVIYLFIFLLAFDDEHCWEPYMPHGNFSSSDITYQLGTTVTFSCSPGFVMEQGSATIECVDPSNPHWNDSEPVCKGMLIGLCCFFFLSLPLIFIRVEPSSRPAESIPPSTLRWLSFDWQHLCTISALCHPDHVPHASLLLLFYSLSSVWRGTDGSLRYDPVSRLASELLQGSGLFMADPRQWREAYWTGHPYVSWIHLFF